MASRNELNMRARVCGFDGSTISNDSKLEQKVLWLEKKGSALTGTAASSTLTSDATNVADGDTVTIDTVVYTFKTVLTAGTPNQVLIGADAATSLDNLKIAVNNTGGTPGTEYTAATQTHPGVSATTNTDTTQLFVARDTNAGHTFPTTETSSHLSWTGTTLGAQTAGVAGVIAAGTSTTASGVGVAGDRNTSI